MFSLVGFILSSEDKCGDNYYKFDVFGLTLSQITLTEGTQVNVFVKIPDNGNRKKKSLSIATVTKSQPNACLGQLEFPIGSVVYCTGSGTVFCVANKPIQSNCSEECCENGIQMIDTDGEKCYVNEVCKKDASNRGSNKKIKVSDSKSVPVFSEIENTGTKIKNVENKTVNKNSEEGTNKITSTEMITPGYKREFPSGLKYEVISISRNVRSDIPQIALLGSKVNVKYEGRLAKTGKKFDSGTLTFTVGSGQVVPGFDQGVKGMIVTETRRVFIPSKLGYGVRGCPPVIPKNADLVFEITLLNTKH
ncbi:immunophilin FKBP-type peptidyl-prolyl cis-trans isomerase [Cryptosporidium bovis]|uniref:immunophilin FKBP-type peptidyl-prolyl cis-trans isomerase n=1 Tax=Cryptosporidium bovis TaxID=310047 RepID=UPI00351AA57C|nr:immunophilin FKBP-type peptidyl-prolyl cis-trans isomerase [Cryptosporidium bovis]